jgi:hypothetical protein
VFQQMIQMLPGLEHRLMTSSEEEVVFIADLVSVLTMFGTMSYTVHRSRKELQAPGPMTRRASKELYWTGSPQGGNHLTLHLLEMSR